MHDMRAIRADPQAFDAAMVRRRLGAYSGEMLEADNRRRADLTALQESQTFRNALSRQIGEAKRRGADSAALELQSAELQTSMQRQQNEADQRDAKIKFVLERLPNRLDPDVPDGADERDNVVAKHWGTPRAFDFQPRQHFELGETLGMMDFAAAAKLSGSRFVVLRGQLARLERALGQFMLDLHTREHGYEETVVPLLVHEPTMYGTGQLPKFAEDLFRTTDGRWLIPTAEVPLTNLAAGEIIAEKRLPLRFTALSECFRSEAGSAGRDTRGMLRQHQFRKVEMVALTRPEESEAEHERMTRCAERVLELLGLPYRRVLLCAGDTGFSAAKTFDLEVWLPGQGAWREISSCSNCRDFQARRMGARYRGADGKVAGFVHTLNGSGLAVGRALIAVMENYQQADGGIAIPPALRPYCDGSERIAPPA
jgi:seryl-tRNA synthetase